MAKEWWDAIKSRFVGKNDESKKMQKYILKQQFEGFSVSNTEGLHKGYDRFQSLLSQLEIHGAGLMNMNLEEMDLKWSGLSHDLNENGKRNFARECRIQGNLKITEEGCMNFGNKDGSKNWTGMWILSIWHIDWYKAYLAKFQEFNVALCFWIGGLACVFLQTATTDVSNKWHRRLENLRTRDVIEFCGSKMNNEGLQIRRIKLTYIGGQQEANHNAGTKDIIDAGDSEKEDESAQDCFVLPIWPSYSSTITLDLKTDEKREGPREEEQVLRVCNVITKTLETVVNVSPIPTSRIHSSHPSALILGDPTSAVQTRSKVNTSSGAHAFVSYVQSKRELPYGK
ncbi:hypothetical protein Tco_0773214 [Tanacetum coccineum]|uniref:Uncharacterized protein n=1 Tax=Tanacetum coccineum TaxID=301880 RepID=A0ABQ4ZP46_9ASTR